MNYYVERVGQSLITIFATISFGFFILRLVPGGPVQQLKTQLLQQSGGSMTLEEVNRLTEIYTSIRPDEPLWVQYVNYMTSILQGDLGRSIVYSDPVAGIMADALPWTIFYAGTSLIIGFTLSIVFGAFMAYLEGSRFDVGSTITITFLNSVPYYIIALLLLIVFAYQLGMFPTGGRIGSDVEAGPNLPFLVSALRHAALPLISLTITGFGGALTMRANSIQVLGSDYLRVGRLRGLSTSRLAGRYVLRNAVLPMYTSFMIAIGTIFGGSAILETIFTYPGMGYYLIQGLTRRDYPLLMASFIVTTAAVVVGILIADLTYGKLDPRAGQGESREAYGGSAQSMWASIKRLLLSRFKEPDDATPDGGRVSTSTGTGDTPFEVTASSDVTESRRDRLRNFFRDWIYAPFLVFWSDWRSRAGLFIFVFFLLMGTVGVFLVPEPTPGANPRGLPPFQNMTYPLGTDILGQSILSAVVHATPPMLKMIFAGAVFSVSMATVVGTFSGYVGGGIDRAIMTVNDILMTIPGLPLVIIIATVIEPRSPYVIGILVTINSWAGLARTLRSQVLVIREESYVEAMRILGDSTPVIILKDILPNLAPYILINFANTARAVIFGSVGLYFLGVFPFNKPNWGVMLNQAQKNNALISPSLYHWVLVPMIVIVLLSFSLILISQGADRVFNPRLKARKIGDEEPTVESME